ncbi:MAG: ThiF family adenylyltransferase [Tannerella sp.]|jgi:molybdopterin/thiamine biosynthesis adenylyltransferase|nr:ThiF family adenylyltransferase [Tannerella sp.]
MEERYVRNHIYVSEEDQVAVRNTKVIFGGAGIGSNIAECALRFGFERITIVDGDRVEENNLNRQNYTQADLGKYKAEALAERLLAINAKAKISFHNCYIDGTNVEGLLSGHDIAVNALDFNSDIPFVFDDVCKKSGIPVLHPYNFGWGGFLSVITPNSLPLSQLSDDPKGFELRMAEYVLGYSSFWNISREWLEKIIHKYKTEESAASLPQLSVASWITAGYCVNVMYNLVTGKDVRTFPKFYLSSIYDDGN